jgi:hypothetical protein
MSPITDERERRLRLWQELVERGADDLDPSLLRDLNVYGGAQGIWVDKSHTGSLTSDGGGVTVGVLHTGRHYPMS